ncbi:MAG: hypothetical protein GTO22_19415, partial [Gemmatimonadales bacterium]|nr:hypothetical protein [Gemmatimonadales bacterium]
MDLRDDEERGVLIVGGQEIPGWLDDVLCSHCDSRRAYYEKYDAFFCPTCKVWLEQVCR